MNTRELFDKYVIPNYTRYPVTLVRGEGAYIWDEEGKNMISDHTEVELPAFGHSMIKISGQKAGCTEAGVIEHVVRLDLRAAKVAYPDVPDQLIHSFAFFQ